MLRFVFSVCLIVFCSWLPTPTSSQTTSWPVRPIRLVVAYPAGGTTDIVGRLLADALSKRLGQHVFVDNRPGAGGTIGALSVARAEPDGYTLLLAASPEVSIAPITTKNLSYDPTKDLQPIAMIGQVPFLLVVNHDLPVKNYDDFIAYAKSHQGQLNYSSFGVNTSNYLAGELFKSLTDIDAVHVPYKGSGPSIIDLIGGQVQFTFDGPPALLANIKADKLRALAVSNYQRLPSLPDVPTFSEVGLKRFSAGTWFGLFAPSKMPRTIVDRINSEASTALATDLSKPFIDNNILPGGGSPEEFERFIRAEVAKWKTLAEKIGIVAN
jgi:tripartite-type tricarboxylate transporter receptor subunit TctC